MLKRPENKGKTLINTIPINDCIAKTIITVNGIEKGISVLGHCLLTGYVARAIMQHKPEWLIQSLFPTGSDLVVADHDVGKVSPVFQEKIHRNLKTIEFPDGQKLGLINPAFDDGGHAAVSQVALSGKGNFIAEIAGRHHGYSPLDICLPNDEKYGGPEWQQNRDVLLGILKEKLGNEIPILDTPVKADILAGLTCVSDWISSGNSFETVTEKDLDDESKVSLKINEVLDNAGITNPVIKHGLTFENIFKFSPREIQTIFINSVEKQGVYILEAPMGLGKTEAALYAAYKVLEAGFATGIYFALPTQLTSNKIFERVQQFIDNIVENNSTKSLYLLHNSAWLYNTEMGGEGAPGGSWFDSRKRGLLAPFGVGTIDQALMAAMNVKHGFVRTYGLAGKVVILDEVHSYDSYTGTILDHLIKVLRQIDCTVIILSATLTTERRNALLEIAEKSEVDVYPRISSLDRMNKFKEYGSTEIDSYNVKVFIENHDNNAVEEVLKRAEQGEQVLWIENTVNDAQEMFKTIGGRAESCNIECGILHSRFLKCDRTVNEDRWVELYGNNAGDKRYQKGRILIGTQVLEQSIDIDSDFLVSRLAPSDMLLQRIGRLWRHRKNDDSRPKNAVREMWILAPEMNSVVISSSSFGNYGFVYSPYVLYRTLNEWANIDTIKIPLDIPRILKKTYEEQVEDGIIAGYKGELQKKIDSLRRFALIGVSRSGVTLPEIKAETRYSETESVDVLLLKVCNKIDNNRVKIVFVNGDELLIDIKGGRNFKEKKRIAALLMNNTVQVPEKYAPVVNIKQVDWLKEYVYIGDERDNPFRVAIVSKSGELRSIGNQNCMNGYSVNYSTRLGYQVAKLSKE